MYICLSCGAEFDEPYPEEAEDFMYNPMIHEVCPECGDDDFEEVYDG